MTAAHQLAGRHAIVKAEVQALDVREESLAQSGLGAATLAKREVATQAGEGRSQEAGERYQQRPVHGRGRVAAADPAIDRLSHEHRYRYLARRPQQARPDAERDARALLRQDVGDQAPTRAASLRVTTHGAHHTLNQVIEHPRARSAPTSRDTTLLNLGGLW